MIHVLDLFSGIGGFSLGLESTGGFETVAFCEADENKRRVLQHHWPSVPVFTDVAALQGTDCPRADVICGGFPCQDISAAGRRTGLAGVKSGLWSHYARLVREIRPRYVLVENVPAITKRGLGRVVGDLADCGYDAEWDCVPGAAVGAPHLRARVWILAYPSGDRVAQKAPLFAGRPESLLRPEWPAEPGVPRVDDGFPGWMVNAYGDAVVPQVVAALGRAILAAEEGMK